MHSAVVQPANGIRLQSCWRSASWDGDEIVQQLVGQLPCAGHPSTPDASTCRIAPCAGQPGCNVTVT